MKGYPSRVYYVRVSGEKQELIRQVEGLRDQAAKNGDKIAGEVWDAVLEKRPVPPHSPVLWDWGSRDEPNARPNFSRLLDRVANQKRTDPHRLTEVWVYEFDRFGVEGVDQWFHYRYTFRKAGCRIVSSLKGELTGLDDSTIIETLFAARQSAEEQRSISRRVTAQMGNLAESGRDNGGLPRYGYDRGCFDPTGERLLWRLHYRDHLDRLQVIATDDNPLALPDVPGAQVTEYIGKDNAPRKSPKEVYKLVPSCDEARVECVRYVFATYRAEAPISWPELARRATAMGYTSYAGSSLIGEVLKKWLYDPTYVGRKSYNKTTQAKFHRYSAGSLEVVAEEEKKKKRVRSRDEWTVPDELTHEPIVDEDTFAEVEALLARQPRKKSGGYAPRSADGWLKPVMFCSGCGRPMVTKQNRGRSRVYHCSSYVMKYNQPGDPSLVCPAGLNQVRHNVLEPIVLGFLQRVESELVDEVERGAIARLEEEVRRDEGRAVAEAGVGYANHLRLVWEALDLDDRGGKLADLIRGLLALPAAEVEERLTGLAEVESMAAVVGRQVLEQLQEEHRHLTLALARPGVSPRQSAVYAAELTRIEGRMDQIEAILTPYREKAEQLAREYQERLDRLADAKKAMAESDLRRKGAAVARLFDRIVVFPESSPVGRRFVFVMAGEELAWIVEPLEGGVSIHRHSGFGDLIQFPTPRHPGL